MEQKCCKKRSLGVFCKKGAQKAVIHCIEGFSQVFFEKFGNKKSTFFKYVKWALEPVSTVAKSGDLENFSYDRSELSWGFLVKIWKSHLCLIRRRVGPKLSWPNYER